MKTYNFHSEFLKNLTRYQLFKLKEGFDQQNKFYLYFQQTKKWFYKLFSGRDICICKSKLLSNEEVAELSTAYALELLDPYNFANSQEGQQKLALTPPHRNTVMRNMRYKTTSPKYVAFFSENRNWFSKSTFWYIYRQEPIAMQWSQNAISKDFLTLISW